MYTEDNARELFQAASKLLDGHGTINVLRAITAYHRAQHDRECQDLMEAIRQQPDLWNFETGCMAEEFRNDMESCVALREVDLEPIAKAFEKRMGWTEEDNYFTRTPPPAATPSISPHPRKSR